jgi:hypothetical protein
MVKRLDFENLSTFESPEILLSTMPKDYMDRVSLSTHTFEPSFRIKNNYKRVEPPISSGNSRVGCNPWLCGLNPE